MTDSVSVTTAYSDERVTLLHGDCIEAMRGLPDDSVDSIVTDPPYGLGFMGKAWDDLPPGLPWAQECLRVLKPGGHLLAFGGSRTWHRLAVAVEDAGFEIRDSIAWLYGSGFPKSLDVSKAIDKAAPRAGMFDAFAAHFTERWAASGMKRSEFVPHFPHYKNAESIMAQMSNWKLAKNVPSSQDFAILSELLDMPLDMWMPLVERVEAERAVTGKGQAGLGGGSNGAAHEGGYGKEYDPTAPATADAERWAGWGTALKPAFEPVVVGRKPLEGKTVAANVLQFGTGALNIDGSRITANDQAAYEAKCASVVGLDSNVNGSTFGQFDSPRADSSNTAGRWPANVILDESQAAVLDTQSGITTSPPVGSVANKAARLDQIAKGAEQARVSPNGHGDTGGASRFFYCAKAPKSERPTVDGVAHPTVKPLSLMRYLVKLVTPLGGTVLEPFAGSGATVEAALLEGFNVIAVEREAEYLPLIMQRVERFSASVTEAEFNAWLSSVQDELPEAPDVEVKPAGRWPANVILDPAMAAALDEQSGITTSSAAVRRNAALAGDIYAAQTERETTGHADSGGASRFFKIANDDEEGSGA